MLTNLSWGAAVVRDVRDLTPTIRLFELAPEAGVAGWAPGSHVDVGVVIDGRAAVRSYSLVGLPDPGVYRIAVKRAEPGRGGSAYMWSLAAGARLQMSAPKNHFRLSFDTSDYLLLAGGIGITPITAIAHALARRGVKMRMAYAVRTEAEKAFAGELGELLGDRLRIYVSEAGQRLAPAAELAALASDGQAYVCGPIGLLDAVRREWTAAQRPAQLLRYETFGNSGHSAPEAFWVRVPRHDVEITVRADETLLDAMERHGVPVLSDCRRGECGLCTMDIREVHGQVDHRDVFFSDREREGNKRLCACVSRAVGGGLVLDSAFRAST